MAILYALDSLETYLTTALLHLTYHQIQYFLTLAMLKTSMEYRYFK